MAWAAERARRGLGATLIEHVTYRAGAHSTSDDPSRYRPKDDYEFWPLGDPITRLKNHLIALGEWTEPRNTALQAELDEFVGTSWKEAVTFGSMSEGPKLASSLMFEDVFETMPPHLVAQRDALAAELAEKSA